MELNDFKRAGQNFGWHATVYEKDLELYDVESDVIIMRCLTGQIVEPRPYKEDFVGFATVKRQSSGEVFDAILMNPFFRVLPDYVSKGMQLVVSISNDPQERRRLDVVTAVVAGCRPSPFLVSRIINFNLA